MLQFLCRLQSLKPHTESNACMFLLEIAVWLWKEPVLMQKMLKVTSLSFHTLLESHLPLVNCVVNDVLRQTWPGVDETLFQLTDVSDRSLVNTLVHQTHDSVVDGFRSGLFDGHRSGEMNSGVCCCRSWTVSRAPVSSDRSTCWLAKRHETAPRPWRKWSRSQCQRTCPVADTTAADGLCCSLQSALEHAFSCSSLRRRSLWTIHETATDGSRLTWNFSGCSVALRFVFLHWWVYYV